MRKFLIILSLPLLLSAGKIVTLTKAQLICLNKTIDRYLAEETDPVFVILEEYCEKKETKKVDILLINKTLPDLSFIPINSSPNAVNINDLKIFTKKELKCLKKSLSKYLDKNKDKIEITLQCL